MYGKIGRTSSKYSIAFALIFICAQASANSSVTLLSATSDAFSGTLSLGLDVDASDVALDFFTVSANSTTPTIYKLEELPQGMVLFNQSSHDVLKVASKNFDPAHGGTVDITYLNDGISGNYETTSVDIIRSGTLWEILLSDQSGRHVVTQAFFKAKKFFGKVIGIAEIDFK